MISHRPRHANKRTGAGARTVLIILAIVAAFLVVGCLACAGLTYFGFSNMVDEAIKEQYNGNPVIEQHVGEIESASLNLSASQAAKEEFGSDEYIVIDLSGPKGEGQLILQRPEGESFRSSDAVLRTSEGDFDLFPGSDMQFEMNRSLLERVRDRERPGRPSRPLMNLPDGASAETDETDSEPSSREAPGSPPRFPAPSEPDSSDSEAASPRFPAPSEPETTPTRPPAFPRPTD